MIDNIGRPAPNIAHILLKFDVDGPIERTVLQPKFHYRYSMNMSCTFFRHCSEFSIEHNIIGSCLKIMLEALETLEKPDLNALIHEFGFQVSLP